LKLPGGKRDVLPDLNAAFSLVYKDIEYGHNVADMLIVPYFFCFSTPFNLENTRPKLARPGVNLEQASLFVRDGFVAQVDQSRSTTRHRALNLNDR